MTDTQDWESRAGSITKRHGAWLIVVHDPEGQAVPDDEFDVASSQAEARRHARRMAEGWGFRGPWRWVPEEGGGCFALYGRPEGDEEAKQRW